jgi:hypothetical protein
MVGNMGFKLLQRICMYAAYELEAIVLKMHEQQI